MLELETKIDQQPTIEVQIPTHAQLIAQAVSNKLFSGNPISKKNEHYITSARNYCHLARITNPTEEVLRAYAAIRSELGPQPPQREDDRYVQGMGDQKLLALIMHVGGYQPEYNIFTKKYPTIFDADTLQKISTIPQMQKDPQYPH